MSKHREAWLKPVSTSDDPLPDRWIKKHEDLLSAVRFKDKTSGIGRGDYILYYAPGPWKKLFALCTAKEAGEAAAHENQPGPNRWPWKLSVQPLIVFPELRRALNLAVLKKESKALMKADHLILTDQEYQRFRRALSQHIAT